MKKNFNFFIVTLVLIILIVSLLIYKIEYNKENLLKIQLDSCNESYSALMNDFNYLQNKQKPECKNTTTNIFNETDFEKYKIIMSHYENYDLNNTLKDYLELQKPYNADDRLKNLALTLKSDSIQKTILNTIKWVHENIEYVNDTFEKDSYHFNSAIKTFEMKKGVCDDMNDLAISLLRINEIPSREVDGNMFQRAYAAKHSWIEILYPYENWAAWKPFDILNDENDATTYYKYYENE